MKYGLIVFKDTENIGDDIQSYAAIKYYPHIDYYIEREEMDCFYTDNKEIVSTIMNGWYLHNRYSFPPSPFIIPLLLSIHFTNYLHYKIPPYFDKKGIEFLKKYEPIGCRDNLVRNNLTDLGIENYFSGCLTLTIPPFMDIKKENKICLVDVGEDIETHIYDVCPNDITIEKVTHRLDKNINRKLSYQERIANVETLLKKYQSCEFVITSRIHCALPCIAMGVPVILIYDDKNIDIHNRMSDFKDIVTFASKEEILTEKNINSIKEKIISNNNYQFLATKLDKQCRDFILNAENKGSTKLDEKDVNFIEYLIENKKRTIKMSEDVCKEYIDYYNKEADDLRKLYHDLVLQHRVVEAEKEYCLSNIKEVPSVLIKFCNSKFYRFFRKVYRLIKKICRKIFRRGKK